jgi:predicted phosphodiesterase
LEILKRILGILSTGKKVSNSYSERVFTIMKLVAFSDTHGQHADVEIPECDVAIFAGDCCKYGSREEFYDFVKWYQNVPAKLKLLTPGNHDFCTQKYPHFGDQACQEYGIQYMADNGYTIDNLAYYGWPWTPPYGNYAWMATESWMAGRLNNIQYPHHVLISHGPPRGILDWTPRDGGQSVGSMALFKHHGWSMSEVHIFGHIHHSYGAERYKGKLYVNCSLLNEEYELVNKPVVINMEHKREWRVE